MSYHALMICIGACIGALSRWQLGIWLNGADWAWGTLLANTLGCFVIGILLAIHLHDAPKLLLITGFLGSFTTFSSFSAEVVQQLLNGQYFTALTLIGLHVGGGLVFTISGILLIRLFQAA